MKYDVSKWGGVTVIISTIRRPVIEQNPLK